MSMVDERDRLAEPPTHGRLAPVEYDDAKRQLLRAPPQTSRAPHDSILSTRSVALISSYHTLQALRVE